LDSDEGEPEEDKDEKKSPLLRPKSEPDVKNE
jgi:hypothetical protein